MPPHFTDHGWTCVEANAYLRPYAVFSFKVRSGFLETFQDRDGRSTSPQRRVLKRAEGRHDAIAGKSLNDATLLIDAFAHEFHEASHQRIGGFLSPLLGKRCEPHHV